MNLDNIKKEYKKMQKVYGDPNLEPIYFGGCEKNPDICFMFMNPTARNIAANSSWEGPRSPWIGTKNIWDLFMAIRIIDEELYHKIKSKKGSEWTPEFAKKVYKTIEKNKIFITNLGKCTQVDARPLPDKVFKEYLSLIEKEIELVNPKIIILFGNQVSSIFLDEKISVSTSRKKKYIKEINNKKYSCFPVYYPIGNGRFNIDKSIEDILWIKEVYFNEIHN